MNAHVLVYMSGAVVNLTIYAVEHSLLSMIFAVGFVGWASVNWNDGKKK